MGGITVTQRFRIAKIVPFRYPRWPPWGPSWNSSNDISQTMSPIELKLDGRHHSVTKIQNCWNYSLPISKMAATAATLKFFKWHLLPNRKSDWAKTWCEALQWHKNSELLKSFRSDIQDGRHGGYLEILQKTASPKPKDITVRPRIKIAKSFRSYIQDGCHGGHLEILQTTSPPTL